MRRIHTTKTAVAVGCDEPRKWQMHCQRCSAKPHNRCNSAVRNGRAPEALLQPVRARQREAQEKRRRRDSGRGAAPRGRTTKGCMGLSSGTGEPPEAGEQPRQRGAAPTVPSSGAVGSPTQLGGWAGATCYDSLPSDSDKAGRYMTNSEMTMCNAGVDGGVGVIPLLRNKK